MDGCRRLPQVNIPVHGRSPRRVLITVDPEVDWVVVSDWLLKEDLMAASFPFQRSIVVIFKTK